MTSNDDLRPTCQRTIITKDWTGHYKRKCGRIATRTQGDQPGGLPLCERHYNRWARKKAKRETARRQRHEND